MDLLEVLRSYGGLSRWVWVPPNFHRPLAAKLCVGSPKVSEVQNVLQVSPITVPSLVGLGFLPTAGAAKNFEFFVCPSLGLSVRLFVTLLNVRVCAPDFAMKALEYRNDFDAIG